nr:reverse transcriptase domain-containing protein [Tanacetum cinerariifolium]
VIQAIHGDDGKLDKDVIIGGQTCWTSIVKEARSLKGTGGVIKDLFPRLYALELHKHATVRMKLMAPSLDNSFHMYFWSLESEGDYSVASIRKLIDEKRFQEVGISTRWVKSVPSKVNITAWKIKTNALPTRFNLSRRRMDIDTLMCPVCKGMACVAGVYSDFQQAEKYDGRSLLCENSSGNPWNSDSEEAHPSKALGKTFVEIDEVKPIPAIPLDANNTKRKGTQNVKFYHQPFVFKETNMDTKDLVASPFTNRIREYDMPDGLKVLTNLKTYDGMSDLDEHLTVFMVTMDVHKLPDPVWCRFFPSKILKLSRNHVQALFRTTNSKTEKGAATIDHTPCWICRKTITVQFMIIRTLSPYNVILGCPRMKQLESGQFLGYMITNEGIKSNPQKVQAIIDLASLKSLRDVHVLNEKLAVVGHFLSKSAERSLTFFKTLKGCINNKDFRWSAEAEAFFHELKTYLKSLPALTTPKPEEALTLYLAATNEAVSAVLLTERGELPRNKERVETKSTSKDSGQPASFGWTLFTNEASSTEGSRAGLVLTDLNGQEVEMKRLGLTPIIQYLTTRSLPDDQTEARKIRIKAPQYTIKENILYQKEYLTPWLRCVGPDEAYYVLRE